MEEGEFSAYLTEHKPPTVQLQQDFPLSSILPWFYPRYLSPSSWELLRLQFQEPRLIWIISGAQSRFT